MRQFTTIEGTPLEGRVTVRRVDVADKDEDEEAFVTMFDAHLPEAEAILLSPWSWCAPSFDEARWSKAGRLRVIAGTFSHRFDGWLNLSEARARNVTVIDTSRSMSPTVAEFGLAMTLNALRDIPAAVQLVRSGSWRSSAPWDQPGFVHGDLAGRRIGLAGFGAVNRRYAELVRPFGCQIHAFDPFVDDDVLESLAVSRSASLSALASQSEIVLVGIAPSPATEGIVDEAVIDALPAGAILIVLSRMSVVDQAALWRRASAGEIRAVVDVFEPEPPPAAARFRQNPWVLPTPHIAGATTQAHRQCFTSACADIRAVFDGREPRYRV